MALGGDLGRVGQVQEELEGGKEEIIEVRGVINSLIVLLMWYRV